MTLACCRPKLPLLLEQRQANGGGPTLAFKGQPEGATNSLTGGGSSSSAPGASGPPGGGAGGDASLSLHYVLFRQGNRVTAFPVEQWFAFKPYVDRCAAQHARELHAGGAEVGGAPVC